MNIDDELDEPKNVRHKNPRTRPRATPPPGIVAVARRARRVPDNETPRNLRPTARARGHPAPPISTSMRSEPLLFYGRSENFAGKSLQETGARGPHGEINNDPPPFSVKKDQSPPLRKGKPSP